MFEKGSQFNDASSTGSPGSATFSFFCKAGGDSLEFVSNAPDPAYKTPLKLTILSGTYTSQSSDNSLGQALTLVVNDGEGAVSIPGGDAFRVAFTLPDPGRSALDLTLTYTPAQLSSENPVPGTGIYLPAQGNEHPILIVGAAGGTRSFCGKFTKR